jgi:hypothetical protein
MRVDLPEPFEPVIAMELPSVRVNESPLNNQRRPKRFDRFVTVSVKAVPIVRSLID